MVTDIQLTDGFVLLRPYVADDASQLHAAILESMTELMPYMSFAHDGYSVEESRTWVTGRPDKWAEGAEYDFAIVDARTGNYLGGCGLNGFNAGRTTANLGYWVRTSMTRGGVATAVTLLLSRFGIEKLNLKRISLVIAVPNVASQRVAEKAGAVREGVLRNGMFVRDLMYDCIIYSIIPQDLGFPASPPRSER